MSQPSALVVGAGGAVGEAIVTAFSQRGWRVHASMRTRRDDVLRRLAEGGASVSFDDIRSDDGWIALAEEADVLVFATRLELTVSALVRLPRAGHVVAFSSNNVAIHSESATYRSLADAERSLKAHCPQAAIIRPTLIYGDPRLETLTRVLRMSREWAVMPLPGWGRALTQPVHHEDLGRLVVGLAERSAIGVYAAGGPDVLTMRALYTCAKQITQGRAVILPVPGPLLSLASLVGAYASEQAERADWDRLAIVQTPLPDELAPRVPFAQGLARHWAAMNP